MVKSIATPTANMTKYKSRLVLIVFSSLQETHEAFLNSRFASRQLFRQRIRAKLEVDGERLGSLAILHQPRGAVAAGAPQAARLPAAFRVVDATVEAFGIEAEGIR